MKIATGLMLSVLSAAVMSSKPVADGRHPEDDGRTRIVETSRFGTLRRKPIPECIQDRIRNRRYFPAGDYTEEARRACERYYREHPERRPEGWKPQSDQLISSTEGAREEMESTTNLTFGEEGSEGAREETSVLESFSSLDFSKGGSGLLHSLGMKMEDLHICCCLSGDDEAKEERKPAKRRGNLKTSPSRRGGNGHPVSSKVGHKDPSRGRPSPNPSKPINDDLSSRSGDSAGLSGGMRGSSSDYYPSRVASPRDQNGRASSLSPPTPCNSPSSGRRPISRLKRFLAKRLRRKNGSS